MDAVYTGMSEVTAEQELALTRVFHVPRRRVFEAFTRPEQLARWWGPDGFTLAACELDVCEGGALRMVMLGPDGRDYPFHGRYVELLPPARLAFTADLETGAPGDVLVTTVNFEEVDGMTWLTVRQTVPATESYARGQRQGWSESLERLAELLAAD
jgi:uncharacterized protein YndB with AHSA1/START domain